MSGKSTRDKGRRGQTAAANLLRSRDWTVADLSAGVESEDILATSPEGVTYAVEVKNCRNMLDAHVSQAKDQAKRRKQRWMLMQKIAGTSSWLVRCQNMRPVVWHGNDGQAWMD